MGDALPFVDLGNPSASVAIACGGEHACARRSDGSIKCWGANGVGQIGMGVGGGLLPTNAIGDQPNEMGDALPVVVLW
jgi:hypothetical protein